MVPVRFLGPWLRSELLGTGAGGVVEGMLRKGLRSVSQPKVAVPGGQNIMF